MPKQFSGQISIVELSTYSGQKVLSPLKMAQTTWLNSSTKALLKALSNDFDKVWLKQGELYQVLQYLSRGTFHNAQFNIDIKKNKGRYRYPDHQQTIDFFYQQIQDRWIGYIPILGIECSANHFEALVDGLKSNIQLEFIRKKRLKEVKYLLEINWYPCVKNTQHAFAIDFYSPMELEQINDDNKTSLLKKVASQYTASQNAIFCLDDALKKLHNTLGGRFPQSVVVIGPNGCGKSALINNFIVTFNQKNTLKIWETSAAKLIQGLSDDSGWQKNFAGLCRELLKQQAILYINHFNELFEVGQYSGSAISMGDAIREPMQRGEIIIIGEATEAELAFIELKNPGFNALLDKIPIKPNDKNKPHIVKNAVKLLAKNNAVEIDHIAIDEIILLQHRYSPYSGFPGKTIRFMEALILKEKHQTLAQKITRKTVIDAFCLETAMPKFLIDSEQHFDQQAVSHFFQQRLFGQNQAINAVISILIAIKASLLRAEKPIANLLFIGPTGVGKTEMAKTLAEYMFADAEKVIRLDMSEYSTPESILRLTNDSDSKHTSLVAKVRQRPFAVLLFDELEKAHPLFFDLLLQILGEGRLTDNKGQIANFCSTIVIMTSNIGAAGFQKSRIGFSRASMAEDEAAKHFFQAVQSYFRPELFNRLDQIITFNPLAIKYQPHVVERQLMLIKKREGMRPYHLKVSKKVTSELGMATYDERYGARYMQRSLQHKVVLPLAEYINSQNLPKNSIIELHDGTFSRQDPENNAEKITLNGYQLSDQVSHLRRGLEKVLEGPIFIACQSEFDKFTAQKNTQSHKFWESKKVGPYKTIQQIINEAIAHKQNIIQIEIASLITLSQNKETATPALLTAWQKQDLTFRKQLLSHHFPKKKRCILAIYGANKSNSYKLVQYYMNIAKKRAFHTTLYQVNKSTEGKIKRRHPSVQAHEKLIGYEIQIEGHLPAIYFNQDNGVLKWIDHQEKADLYYIQLFTGKIIAKENTFVAQGYEIPETVYRKHFFDDKIINRTYHHGKIILKKEKIELVMHDITQVLAYYDRQFILTIDKMLMH